MKTLSEITQEDLNELTSLLLYSDDEYANFETFYGAYLSDQDPSFIDILNLGSLLQGMGYNIFPERGLTGAEEIAQERAEQLYKHGWDLKNDQDYDKGQLLDAALQSMALVKPDYFHPAYKAGYYWPWPLVPFFYKIKAKDPIGQLRVAGAFIAAEIDRLKAKADSDAFDAIFPPKES